MLTRKHIYIGHSLPMHPFKNKKKKLLHDRFLLDVIWILCYMSASILHPNFFSKFKKQIKLHPLFLQGNCLTYSRIKNLEPDHLFFYYPNNYDKYDKYLDIWTHSISILQIWQIWLLEGYQSLWTFKFITFAI